jgi:hypothetical protein
MGLRPVCCENATKALRNGPGLRDLTILPRLRDRETLIESQPKQNGGAALIEPRAHAGGNPLGFAVVASVCSRLNGLTCHSGMPTLLLVYPL